MKLDYTKVDSVQEKDVPYLDEGVEKTADLIRTTYTPTNFEGTTTNYSIRDNHPNRDSKLEKFDFELSPLDESLTPAASQPLLGEAPNIDDQQLQLVAETTEATNNIINETITRMLAELGDNPSNQIPTQIVSAANNVDVSNQENKEAFVFSNALSSFQRLKEIEDIRAIFQILGIGS